MLIAGGRDKGVDLRRARRASPARPRTAAVLIGESGPALEALLAGAGVAAHGARRDRWTRPSRPPTRWPATRCATGPPGTVATVLLSPAAASFDMFEDYAARGRAFIAAVGRLAEATMSTTPVTAVRRTPRNAVPRTAPRTQITLQRERHEPEYGILVAIVALAAIGILMVYSSSAMKAFLQRDDTFAIVGPADPVGRARAWSRWSR